MVLTLALVMAAAASARCGSPNYYAVAANTSPNGGVHYGARGLIYTSKLTVPQQNENFTAQHFTATGTNSSYGLEVGWYIGWGAQTHTYVTDPHAYATLNPTSEVDGPDVGSSDYLYGTYWSGSTQEYFVRYYLGGGLVWSGSQNAHYSGPGNIYGMGEVPTTSLPMWGQFDGPTSAMEYFSGTGAWDQWTGLSFCADSPFTISGNIYQFLDK